MKVEKVKAVDAPDWMHVRRMTHGEFKEWVKGNKDDTLTASTRAAAICLCDSAGKPKWTSKDEAMQAIDAMDWKLVRDISDQAIAFCGFDTDIKDAEKNS